MTRLLVSVRNAVEAQDALTGGADLIDIKEPSRGSLGRATGAVWREVANVVGGKAPLSVALGELLDDAFERAPPIDGTEVRFAKLGLSGCGVRQDWFADWRRAVRSWPASVGAVAVAYADWRTAQAPPPDEVLAAALALPCSAFLIDTFDKRSGGLLDLMSYNDLAELVRGAQSQGLLAVLAGSLTSDCMTAVLAATPDYVAVRGAVCRGGREGVLDAAMVCQLARTLAANVRRGLETTRTTPAIGS